MTNFITTTNPASLLLDVDAFDHMQRVAKMLALSPLFPEHLRKGGTIEQAVANGVLVLNMAARLNEDPLTVAQNIYFVSGRPGWSTSYMISKANQHGVFKNPIDWEISGKGDSLSVTALAEVSATGRSVSFTCDMAMAKAEGWTRNKKYQSMPELMLRYRSAAALIRLYCPEVMIGVPSQIELETGHMKDVTPPPVIYPDEEPERKAGGITGSTTAPTTEEPPKRTRRTKAEMEAARAAEEEPKPNPAADNAIDAEATRVAEARAKAKAAAEPEVVEEGHDQETGEVYETNTPDSAQFQALYDTILNDLMDAPNVKDVVDMYEPQIASMKEVAPALHTQLLAEIAAADE